MRGSLVTLALCAVAAVSAQDFGPPVVDRSQNDGATHITFISNHAAPTSGEISEWRLWAGVTGEVKLQMWRAIPDGMQLIGSNSVVITATGLNVITIPTGRIQVQAGDIIGFRYNSLGAGAQPIDFDQHVGGSYRWTNWPDGSTDVGVGGTISNGNLGGQGEGREYSVAATVVPEPISAVGLLVGLAALRRRRRS